MMWVTMLNLVFVGINVGGEVNMLISNMGLDSTYEVYRLSAISSATAGVTLSVLGDGTWTVTKNAGATDWVQGSTFSGNWGLAGVTGSDYEVSFNNGSSYQDLSVTRTFGMTANDTTVNNGSVTNSSGVLNLIVRKIGTTSPTSTDSTTLIAEDEYSTV